MTQWDRDVKAAGTFRSIGIVLVGAGLVAVVAASVVVDGTALRYPAFALFMLGMHALALSEYQRRLARLQAALDMKRMALNANAPNVNERLFLPVGDALHVKVGGKIVAGYETDTACTLTRTF